MRSGVYIIHSDYNNDNRCVDLRTQDNETIQLYFCNGGNEQKFRITLRSDGTYVIAPAVNGPRNAALGMQVQNGVQAVHSFTNSQVTWTIQQAAGSPAGSQSMNILVAGGLFEVGVATPISLAGMLWNRRDPDAAGRIQLVQPGPPDPHNNFSFQLVQ